MKPVIRYICLSLALLLCGGSLMACLPLQQPAETTGVTETADTTTAATVPPETTATSATESETTETSATETTESDSTEPETPADVPPYVNPLTGLAVESDFSTWRPAAIMVNNIKISCPQNGVGAADIIYECLVEGGMTRLMLVSMDYENLPEVGSIRSSRDYYLDFAADYDALYIHAGGSEYAYLAIHERGVQNIDGVNMWTPSTFYQDKDRLKNMGYEHSWMTTGEGIASGVKYKRYRTLLTADHDYPLDFVPYGTTVSFEDSASHIRIPYSLVQTTDFVYDEETGTYLRYQFNGEKHIDGLTNDQLAFENVMIYFCETDAISGDPKHRINVGTVGTGTGYYATKGTVIPITWEKDDHESPIRFYDAEGEPLLINAGKTFVSVCPTNIEKTISFNFEW